MVDERLLQTGLQAMQGSNLPLAEPSRCLCRI